MKMNEKPSAETHAFYDSPRLRVVQMKARGVLCQSGDISNAGEDSENMFGTGVTTLTNPGNIYGGTGLGYTSGN